MNKTTGNYRGINTECSQQGMGLHSLQGKSLQVTNALKRRKAQRQPAIKKH